MNNINCEHCGSLINVEIEKKCPNCGAPYKNNKQYKEYKEYIKKQSEVNIQSQKVDSEIKNDVFKKFSVVFAISIIFTIIIFISVVTIFIMNFKDISDIGNDFPNYDEDYYENSEKISVKFNQTAITDEYNIKVNKIEKYKNELFTNNKTYYAFNIVFKNKSNKWRILNNIKLLYIDNQGDEQEANKRNIPEKMLDDIAIEMKTYEGFVYYDIPNYVKDVKLVYNNVNITIDDFQDKIN